MSEAAVLDTSPDTPAEALAALRASQQRLTREEVERFELTCDYVAMNLVEPGEGATYTEFGADTGMPLAGPGAPEVGEFAVTELAATLGMSTAAGQRHVGAVMEIRYRLPRHHAQVVSGQLPLWRAKRITEHTLNLSYEAAAFVDRMLAPVAATCSWAQLDRLVEEAILRFDPEAADAKREAGAEQRKFDIHTDQATFEGIVHVEGALDLTDAQDLDHAIAQHADQLKRLGCEESLDVRRALAAGHLARNQQPLDFDAPETEEPAPEAENPAAPDRRPTETGSREIVLHLHLTDAAITGGEIGRCENTRTPLSPQAIRDWCGAEATTQITIKPVTDLNEQIHLEGYEVRGRLREQTGLRDLTCVFPGCTRPAKHCERDHIVPYDQGGPTSTANIACLCTRHHRAKTHGGFRYRRIGPAAYEWTTPHGYKIIRDHHGTHAVEDP